MTLNSKADKPMALISIGRFRGGAKGGSRPPPPLFPCIFKARLQSCFENCFVKCSLILSPETSTFLTLYHEYDHNAVCCKSWKVKFSFRWVRGGGGGLGPLFLNFLDPPLISGSNWNLECWFFWIIPGAEQEPTTSSTHMCHQVQESHPSHSSGRQVPSPLR